MEMQANILQQLQMESNLLKAIKIHDVAKYLVILSIRILLKAKKFK